MIVLHPKESELFEQVIFILNDNVAGRGAVTDAQLLQEAGHLMGNIKKRKPGYIRGFLWASMGALTMSVIFLIFSLF